MPSRVSKIVRAAARDLRAAWRSLAATDLTYKLIAFALLTPAVTLLARWLLASAPGGVVADVDIARFLLGTAPGIAMVVAGGALVVAITALEASCLMAIAFARENGVALPVRTALGFAGSRSLDVLRLTLRMVLRLLVLLVPFALAIGLVYLALLRDHDINFYLSRRPPEMLAAMALAGLVLVALAATLLVVTARWSLALPLLLFERVPPGRALAESTRRTAGDRRVVLVTLALWAAGALALAAIAGFLPEIVGRPLAPWFAGGLVRMLLFVACLLIGWGALVLAAGIVNFSMFALLITRIYLEIGEPRDPRGAVAETAAPSTGYRFSGRRLGGVLALVAVLAVAGIALALFLAAPGARPVVVIAHRGASVAAPENTLAAFRLAIEQRADFYELDVQESKDGEIVVVHDSDLMKVGGGPAKIWEATAEELRQVDIGSRFASRFASERVPTLREALELDRKTTRVIVELKSYGHDERLEERVIEIVESVGADCCVFMSLDHDMVRRMKELRPSWTSGVLVAKAMGDLSTVGGDFLAVEARMATPRFVRRAHRAGKAVYVWTVNDPAWMLTALGRGVDGLITDTPQVARHVLGRYEKLSLAQRFLAAVLVRLGARSEALAAENALRP